MNVKPGVGRQPRERQAASAQMHVPSTAAPLSNPLLGQADQCTVTNALDDREPLDVCPGLADPLDPGLPNYASPLADPRVASEVGQDKGEPVYRRQ